MKWIQLIVASLLIVSLSHAEAPKKLLTPEKTKSSKNKKAEVPAWMKQDAFTVSTIDGKRIHLLSTKKGFSFDGGENKMTILVVWKTSCKSCSAWLEDMEALQKTYPDKVKIIALEIGNTQKKKLEKLVKEKRANSKEIQKIINQNHLALQAFAKNHHLSFPIISVLSNQGNLAFTMQTLYKYQFNKPRGKAKRGGGLPFTVVFGYEGQTAGITAGISEKEAYKAYIGKLIKHYEKKK
jgi:CRISPR/Cas system-associated protein endoribonuclease Cas2